MKMPRDILLEVHQSAVPELDRVRSEVIASLPVAQRTRRAIFPEPLATLWRELITPQRHLWTGLATVWIALLAIHLMTRPEASESAAQSSPDCLALVLEQRRELHAELFRPGARKRAPVKIPPQARDNRLPSVRTA